LSDPENPVESSQYPDSGNLAGLTDMKVSNDYVYLIQNDYYALPFTSAVHVFMPPI